MSQITPDETSNLSSQTFLTSLATNAGVLAIELVAFVFLKHRLSRIYEPRTYLPPPDKRAIDLPPGWWKWFLAIIAIPTGDVLQKNGLDAYMFLRFLRLLIIMFGSITLLSCAVLLPVDTAGIKNSTTKDLLSRLSWGNIPDDATGRYAAHVAVVYLSTFWSLFLIRRELKHYAVMRQQFLVSRSHAVLAQARTVLITSIPTEMCDEKELKLWASFVPGGIQNIWIYRDTTSLNQDYKDRLKACKKLESAISKLIRQVVKAKGRDDRAKDKIHNEEVKAEVRERRLGEKEKRREEKALSKRRKAGEKEAMKAQREYEIAHGMAPSASSRRDRRQGNETGDTFGAKEERVEEDEFARGEESPTTAGHSSNFGRPSNSSSRPLRQRTVTSELEAGQLPPSPTISLGHSRTESNYQSFDSEHPSAEAILNVFMPPEKRPHYRLGFLGLWGKKVDTIEWCTDAIARLNKSIDNKREVLATGETKPKPMGSAFIQCNLQMGAHVLAQCVSYHQPLMMSEKWIEVSPKDVIWDNIDDGAYETRFRYVTSWMGSIALIIIWFAPVAFVGTLSNVSTLCKQVSWLCWIGSAPTPIPGIIQGILPPLFLAILFAILPWLLKGLAWYENIPRWSLLSISVYKRYFFFLVIHGFLIVTLSSGLTSTATQLIENPTQAITYLATQLPNASIFFLTWTLTQGLSGAGSALLQVGQLFIHFLKKWFLGRTPRQAFGVTFKMPKADFGLVLPRMSLLATIALAYSVLSPIINALATVSFVLFFFSWKFLLTWVFDQPDEFETGGQYFPLAIAFLFVGLYIEQFCLAALFFLSFNRGVAFIVEGVLMVLLMGFTLCIQLLFKNSFDPITHYLPMSLATKNLQERWERQRKRSGQARHVQSEGEDMDLFSRDGLKSLVRRRIQAPVEKVVKDVQKNVAKAAMINSINTKDTSKAQVVTSAHEVSRSTREQELSISPTLSEGDDTLNFPKIAPPADSDIPNEDDIDQDFDIHGFDHPSTYASQPWIWIPKDKLGLSEFFVSELRVAGVDASDGGAMMDCKGDVEVNRGPPDEDWAGGL